MRTIADVARFRAGDVAYRVVTLRRALYRRTRVAGPVERLLASRLAVRPVVVGEPTKCRDTGEVVYGRHRESCLFDSDAAARREVKRVVSLVRNWGT